MTENEEQAVKWMKSVRDDAVAILDYIAKNEPNVSPMLYAGRKEKAGVIIKGFEELERYRAIGTVEECREARERQKPKKPVKDEYNHACCSSCGWIVHKDERGGRHLPHCENCGQAIDWIE